MATETVPGADKHVLGPNVLRHPSFGPRPEQNIRTPVARSVEDEDTGDAQGLDLLDLRDSLDDLVVMGESLTAVARAIQDNVGRARGLAEASHRVARVMVELLQSLIADAERASQASAR